MILTNLKEKCNIIEMEIDEMSAKIMEIEFNNWSKEMLEKYIIESLKENIEKKKVLLEELKNKIKELEK